MLPREYMKEFEARAVGASEAKATELAEGLALAQMALDLFLAKEKRAATFEGARPQMMLSSVRLGDRMTDIFAQWEHHVIPASANPKTGTLKMKQRLTSKYFTADDSIVLML